MIYTITQKEYIFQHEKYIFPMEEMNNSSIWNFLL